MNYSSCVSQHRNGSRQLSEYYMINFFKLSPTSYIDSLTASRDQPNFEYAPKWKAVWKLVNKMVNERSIIKPDKQNFKINRREIRKLLTEYSIQNNFSSVEEYLRDLNLTQEDLNHSILKIDKTIIILDYNSAPGDYQARYIGCGKFGRVKLGLDIFGNKYSVKKTRFEIGNNSIKENKILNKLSLLVGVMYYKTSTAKPWIDNLSISDKEIIVTKYLEGKTLSTYFSIDSVNNNNFTLLDHYIIALALIKKVDDINSLGIAHRDIKPENILLDLKHLPRNLSADTIERYLNDDFKENKFSQLINLIDWGLACEIPTDGSEIKLDEKVRFSCNYTAPECYTENKISCFSESYVVTTLIKKLLRLNEPLLDDMVSPCEENLVLKYENAFYSLDKLLKNGSAQNEIIEKQRELLACHKALLIYLKAHPARDRMSLDMLYDELHSKIKKMLKKAGGVQFCKPQSDSIFTFEPNNHPWSNITLGKRKYFSSPILPRKISK